MVFPWVSFIPRAASVVSDMPDNFTTFEQFYNGTTAIQTFDIGFNRGENVRRLIHSSQIATGNVNSLHIFDDSTSYQNTSGADAYAIVTVRKSNITTANTGFKIWSSSTENSATGTEVYDSADYLAQSSWQSQNDKLTSQLVTISNSHYINIENSSTPGSSGIDIDVLGDAIVIETQ